MEDVKLFKLPCNKQKYRDFSQLVRQVMKGYDEYFESVGLDEGYLNLTPLVLEEVEKKVNQMQTQPDRTQLDQMIDDQATRIMKNIQKDVLEKTGGLTLSLGMAPNRFLSKLASEKNKPNGCYILRREKQKVLEFLDSFPLGKIKYIGPHNERIIRGFGSEYIKIVTKGIENVSQLRESLWKFYLVGWKEKKREKFTKLSIGYDNTIGFYQTREKAQQSLSKSRSFCPDLEISSVKLLKEFERLGNILLENLQAKKLIPQSMSVRIVRSDLETESKCKYF